jgi:hypothetical protein
MTLPIFSSNVTIDALELRGLFVYYAPLEDKTMLVALLWDRRGTYFEEAEFK